MAEQVRAGASYLPPVNLGCIAGQPRAGDKLEDSDHEGARRECTHATACKADLPTSAGQAAMTAPEAPARGDKISLKV